MLQIITAVQQPNMESSTQTYSSLLLNKIVFTKLLFGFLFCLQFYRVIQDSGAMDSGKYAI
jgi:hypothetical protein